jgi:hypothetical protein
MSSAIKNSIQYTQRNFSFKPEMNLQSAKIAEKRKKFLIETGGPIPSIYDSPSRLLRNNAG